MKRYSTRIKEVELTQARLSRLRQQRAEIDIEIALLEAEQEANVVDVVTDTIKRLDIAHFPITEILARLAEMSQNLQHTVAPTSKSSNTASPGRVAAFVKLTRNASVANRAVLETAGLHWNGRARGWSGRVTTQSLEHLRSVFGERVEKPAAGD